MHMQAIIQNKTRIYAQQNNIKTLYTNKQPNKEKQKDVKHYMVLQT